MLLLVNLIDDELIITENYSCSLSYNNISNKHDHITTLPQMGQHVPFIFSSNPSEHEVVVQCATLHSVETDNTGRQAELIKSTEGYDDDCPSLNEELS